MEEEVEGSTPKRARLEQTCIIHCTSDDTGLYSIKDKRSWDTLLRAAQTRNHQQILNIASGLDENEIPQIKYHRKCRSIFTMKRLLDDIQQSEASPDLAESSHDTRKSLRSRPSDSRLYEVKCILCTQKSKYMKSTRTHEPLVKCTTLAADTKLRDAATRKMDQNVLSLLSRDIVAAEAHYHRTCYRQYTKVESSETANSQGATCDTNDEYSEIEGVAYTQLFSYIRNELLSNPRVITLKELTKTLVTFMNDLGCPGVKIATKKHIRRKLETEFADELHFVSDPKGKLIVYPENMSRDMLVVKLMQLKADLELSKSSEKDSHSRITKVALQIRADIKSQDGVTEWPPQPTALTTSSANLPDGLTYLLNTIICGRKPEASNARIARLVNSYAQDIVYTVTGGKQRPPKHVLLPIVVKALTGNVELIQMLNRLGHCVSYSMTEQIETALCLQKLEKENLQKVHLPANILSHEFTTLVWDNIDRLEETPSGSGTSHRVNGIAIQPAFIGPLLLTTNATVPKTKLRSISHEGLPLPRYNAGERVGSPSVQTVRVDASAVVTTAVENNHMFVLCRQNSQSTPSWTGSNIITRDMKSVSADTISYLPTINAPATDMSTVYQILNQSHQIMKELKLSEIVCVFDQALYAKAAEITWKHTATFQNIILRMGDFHTIMNFLSILGKRFQDAGLKELCVESGIIAEGSVQAVMDGRQYNRAVRMHKLVYEALLRLVWKEFLPWLQRSHPSEVTTFREATDHIKGVSDDLNESNLTSLMSNETITSILRRFEDFLNVIRSGSNGELAAFWVSYIDMVEILLGLLRASREGNWMLHLGSIRAMLPWVFAYDKINYARYLPVYYAQMTQLPTTHPGVHDHFMNGGFSAQRSSKNPFGKIPADQAIEETVNKDTQTAGGTKGFSLKPAAVKRFYLNAEHRGTCLRQLRNMVHYTDNKFTHTDLQVTRIQKDQAQISSVLDILEHDWINPMHGDEQDLVSISSGRVAPQNVLKDIQKAHKTGEEAYAKFKENRLDSTPPIEKFHDRIAKQSLQTFSTLNKKNKIGTVKGKEVVLYADRNLFGHMLLAAQSRSLDLRDVMSHPLGNIPWALATPDGLLRKTNKANFGKALLENVSAAEDIPSPSPCIIDGMCIVQRINGDNETFESVATHALSMALHEGDGSDRIDVVFDVYRDMSIKNAERQTRGSNESIHYKNIAPGHTVRQWRKFLSNSSNKQNLIVFLVEEWKKPASRNRLGDKVLYVTCETRCFKLAKDSCDEIGDLESTQEEADTRIMLHAAHAADDTHNAIVISADDTDVLVLAIAFENSIPCPMYQKIGTRARQKYVDISKVAASLGDEICTSILGLHSFTGCDTVGAFSGKGKLGALKLLKKERRYQQCFACLGQSWDLSPDMLQSLEAFTCHMYMAKSTTRDVNECRYQLFCARKGEAVSTQLPPCKDSLSQHSKRANYQAAIWRRCLHCDPKVPNPFNHGWVMNDGNLDIHWMTGSPAPSAVLELMSCSCKRSCDGTVCPCMGHGLKCTQMCKLQSCSNQITEEEDVHAEFEDDDDDGDM